MDKAYVQATLGRTVPQNFFDWFKTVTDHRKLVKWAIEDLLWHWLGQTPAQTQRWLELSAEKRRCNSH